MVTSIVQSAMMRIGPSRLDEAKLRQQKNPDPGAAWWDRMRPFKGRQIGNVRLMAQRRQVACKKRQEKNKRKDEDEETHQSAIEQTKRSNG